MKQLIVLLTFLPLLANAQLRISLESGLVSTQYNDVRAPNGDQNGGTLFSFAEDFESVGSPIFLRGEIAYLINNKHTIEATAAPLTINYTKLGTDPIDFEGVTYSGAGITGSYQFNTYRFSYRYRVLSRAKLTLDLGASLLVRDAKIALAQPTSESENTDLGYVPLVSFELNYAPYDKFSFLLKGDALVGPVGRAEDIFVGVLYKLLADNLQLKAGYRLIEGGADVDQVYNFAYFHFIDLGLVYRM